MSPIALNTDVNDCSLMRLRWALNFEKATSINFKSDECGGRYRNQQLCALSSTEFSLSKCVVKLSRTAAILSAFPGVSCLYTESAKAGPSLTLLITKGAIKASMINHTIRVWAPLQPKYVFIIRRSRGGPQPRRQIKCVFTDVSWKKPMRSCILVIADKRCVIKQRLKLPAFLGSP